jgi:hypothetical protein
MPKGLFKQSVDAPCIPEFNVAEVTVGLGLGSVRTMYT